MNPWFLGFTSFSNIFGNFTNFGSHTIPIYFKNIGHDCGNTTLEPSGREDVYDLGHSVEFPVPHWIPTLTICQTV